MLKQLQTEEILRLTRTGIWQVEMEQGGRRYDGLSGKTAGSAKDTAGSCQNAGR